MILRANESFGTTMAKPPLQAPTQTVNYSEQIKVLEERFRNVDRKTEVIEDNILSVNKRQNVEIRTLMARLLESQKELDMVKKRMVEMANDMHNFARKEAVDTLKKYVEYWEPIKFVTNKEVEELVKAQVARELSKSASTQQQGLNSSINGVNL